jgi:hypothetical protein
VEGDLFDYSGPGVYLCHQTNCRRQGKGAGLAVKMFERYPCADTYVNRTQPSKPGTNEIFHDGASKTTVVNMNGQDSWRPYAESQEQREKWFQECLDSLIVPAGSKVYFPHMIGCGLARGDWNKYMKMIAAWAQAYERIRVTIVSKYPDCDGGDQTKKEQQEMR